MALTGTGLRVNTDAAADNFGASVTFPRGLASDGTTCILFDARTGFELNVQTGIATRIGSVANFLINEGQLRGATYLEDTDQVIFWGNSNNRFYAYNRQNGIAGNLGLQFASAWDFWALASLNGVLYAIDRATDALYIIDLSAGTATRVGTADAFGIGTGNVQSLCVYDGRLHAFSATLDRMILIDETDGTASIVNDMDLPDGSPEAAVEHGGNLYYAGSSNDALFRMYDVLWDETIANPEIDEGDSETLLDLSTVSQDGETYALQGDNEAWLSVSGNDFVATNAPNVTADTDYDANLRATRDGINVDKTIQVTVRDTGVTPPPNTPPAFDETSYAFTGIAIANGTVVGTVAATDADSDTLSYSLTGTDADKFDIDANGQITAAEALDYETTYNFNVVADDSTDTTSVAVSVTTVDAPLVATTVVRVSGNNQSAQVGIALANPLVIQVNDQNGDPLSGVDVAFSTTLGTLSSDSDTTDANGRAETRLTLSSTVGTHTVTATVTGITAVTFTATATAAPPPPNTAPSFANTSYAFPNVAIAVGTVVGTVAATDADNDSLTYSLTGTDAAKFDIDSSGEITVAEALNHDTDYNVNVVADDGTDTTSVGVTISTAQAAQPPLTIPPKILLFKKQLNRVTTPAVAGDNDYSTYATANTVTIAIDKAGVAQAFDTLFFKMQNVTSYVIEVDGNPALPTRTVPANLTEVTELGDVSILRHGYQHDLYELSATQTGSTVEITFTGTNIRISEVWVLKQIAVLEKLNKFSHSQIDRDSEPQSGLYGYDEIEVNTGLDRLRWQSSIELEFTHTDDNYEVFLDLIEDHAEEGIVVAQEPRRLPWRTYQAIFANLSHAAPYLCSVRPAGSTIQFVIDEARKAAPLWYSMDTFNTNDSGDGLMFFKPCPHLFQNGAVDDNDYKTFSTGTTHTFDTEAVSHVFIKSTGVTSYQVQTLVSGTWTTQETLTPTQKTYRGFENSLTQLTTRLVADQVRLVFTGTNIEVYEVMCLDRGGEILTDTDGTLLSKTDRTGVIHEGQGGGVSRSRVRRSQRMKWDIQVRSIFGHFDDFVIDDVLDWINAYPNFVFSYLPNVFPWRTFPATWTDQQFQQAFLTTILQNGDYLQMNVKER